MDDRVYLNVRLDPAIRRAAKIAAMDSGRSLEKEIETVLRAHYKVPEPVKSNGKPKLASANGTAKARATGRERVTV